MNLIDHLPRHSFYVEAMANDEELAEAQADKEQEPYEPRLSEWSPEMELFAAMFEISQANFHAFLKAHGGKPSKFQRWPRPVTAVQRISQRKRRNDHESLVERLLPKK